MSGDEDRWTEEIRRLRLGGPDPALRERVLRAVRAELAGPARLPGWRQWLAQWRTEALMAAAIAICLCMLPWLGGGAHLEPRGAPGAADTAVEQMVDQLQINGGLRPYVRLRLAAAEQARRYEGRTGYHGTRTEFPDWDI